MANTNQLKTAQIISTDPPDFVMPALQTVLKRAQAIYDNRNKGAGQADINAATRQIRAMADNSGKLYDPALTQIGNIARGTAQIGTGNAYDAMAKSGVPFKNAVAQGIRSGNQSIGTEGDFRALLGEAGGPGAAESYLAATARGDYLGGGDPFLDDVIADTNRNIATQLKDMYSGAGRYGGATMNADLINRLYANEAGARSAAYQQERDRQMQAAGMIEDAQQGRLGLRRGLTGDITGVQQANLDNRLGAEALINQNALANAGFQLEALSGLTGVEAQNLRNRMDAAGVLPMLDAARYQGADRLMALGEIANNGPWDDLGKYASLLYPMAGFGGVQTVQERATPWLNALGAIGNVIGWFK
ncbi:MAG: hypothetical protein KIS96_10950 [Bauldia sp.]|nr:hypothetical protein [Bauldia sp.]